MKQLIVMDQLWHLVRLLPLLQRNGLNDDRMNKDVLQAVLQLDRRRHA
jgi:hypothetical protein